MKIWLLTFMMALNLQAKTDLFKAVEDGDFTSLEKAGKPALQMAKSPQGESLLQRAASLEKEDLALKLLGLKSIDVNQRDKEGTTALFVASSSGQQSLVSALLSAGAKTDFKYGPNEDSILVEAFKSGNERIINMLIEKDSSLLERRSKDGQSAFNAAVTHSQYRIAYEIFGKKPKFWTAQDIRSAITELKTSRSPEARKLRARLESGI